MSESHELLGVKGDPKTSLNPDGEERGRLFKIFMWIFVFLVILPVILSFILYGNMWVNGQWGNAGGMGLLIIPMTFYFFPPFFIFGGTYFETGMIIAPNGYVGLFITAAFYTVASLILALPINEFRTNKNKN